MVRELTGGHGKGPVGRFVGILFVNRRIGHHGVQGIGIIPSQDTRGIASYVRHVQAMDIVLVALSPTYQAGVTKVASTTTESCVGKLGTDR